MPGSAAIKNLDWSVFLPITSSPGYQPGNKLPYGEHYNFSIQRQFGSSTVMTVAYVGTEGHKLFAQYEANPGDANLCLSLRGSGVAKGEAQCGPNLENSKFTKPDGRWCSAPGAARLAVHAGSNTYHESTMPTRHHNSLQVTLQRSGRPGSHLPGLLHLQQGDG